jgi:colicin import membrane protein
MSAQLGKVIALNGYPLSVVVALTLHTVLLVSLLYIQGVSQTRDFELVQPTVIKALFLDENPQLSNQRKAESKRREDDRRQRQQAEYERELASQKQQQEEEQNRQRLAADKLARDKAVKDDIDKLKRQEEEKKLEKQRIESELAAIEREAASKSMTEASEQPLDGASSEFELIQSAISLIQELVEESWSRPPSARNGMRAIIEIKMLPTGDLTSAQITRSSGDAAFDRSAENAVYSAAPFRELQTLPIRIFNENFRVLALIFQPEDLLN